MITLDGFFEGPNREIDWHNVDEEFNVFACEQLREADVLLFGRVTYELMASYWPSSDAVANDPIIANLMNTKPKIVFSRTLSTVDWNNTRLVKENSAEVIARLKQMSGLPAGAPAQIGKDLMIFGSADFASGLARLGLIDEYRLMVNPVVLGNGKPLFKNLSVKLNLKLLRTRVFRSGNVLLYYQPDREKSLG